MPRVAGIDPGTLSLDIVCLEDGRPFLERSFTPPELAAGPREVVGCLEGARPLDLVAGPSGYGLPLVPVADLGDRDLRLLLLADRGSRSPLGGLGSLLRALRDSGLPVVVTPGVVHLGTVPSHRKANRIDLGTADKVAVAAFAIDDQSRRLGIGHGETSFLLVEMGGAFTAVLSVEGGRIVSGQGGSSGPMGFRAAGALDGEVALVMDLGKQALFSGGAAFVGGDPGMAPEDLTAGGDPRRREGLLALVEGVVKSVAGELAILGQAREVLLSGRLSRVPGIYDPIASRLGRLLPVRRLKAPRGMKEAAYGAALIADGLAGGRYQGLVDGMDLKGASGTALDHLFLEAPLVPPWMSAS
jgi:predicted butyrate kinase (DUF1464 family)